QSASPIPKVSKSPSKMSSLSSNGRARADDRFRASVVLPLAGSPETITKGICLRSVREDIVFWFLAYSINSIIPCVLYLKVEVKPYALPVGSSRPRAKGVGCKPCWPATVSGMRQSNFLFNDLPKDFH